MNARWLVHLFLSYCERFFKTVLPIRKRFSLCIFWYIFCLCLLCFSEEKKDQVWKKSRCRNDIDSQRSSTFRENHFGKKLRNWAGKSCLIRTIAQTWHHPITICSGRCSTPWPRESSQIEKKSNPGWPTSLSRSRPSSSKEESILCVNVNNKSLIVMENIPWIDLV